MELRVLVDKCTGCGWCEQHCPDFAISVRARKVQAAAAPTSNPPAGTEGAS